MSYATVLLHLDGAASAPSLVEATCRLAAAHGSHVIGLTTTGNAWFEGSLAAGMLSRRELDKAVDAARALARARADEFAAEAARRGLASFDVVVDDRDALSSLADRSLYCDLVVMGRPERSHPNPTWPSAEFERSLSACAAPMLVMSGDAGQPGVARRILVAWQPEPACARALAGALPLLQAAEHVDVMHADSPFDPLWRPDLDDGLDRVVDRLSRHGVGATLARCEGSAGIGLQLVAHVRRTGAELLVMGAWGRPRWSERLFGGATRSLLLDMPVPVLFAH